MSDFISKSVSLGRNKEEAKRLFDLILKFAGYGFTKSHSVAYSLIAYKQAYLKKHYPLVFFKHLLTSVIGSESKTSEYIKEASSQGINIIKPTINLSEEVYSIKDNSLVFPLSNIKSIGKVTSSTILEERKNGVFTDIYNTISRLTKRGIGIKTLETLVYAGVFKEFFHNRATLIYNLDNLFNYGELTKDMDENLVPKPEIDYQKDYSDEYLLEKEKELQEYFLIWIHQIKTPITAGKLICDSDIENENVKNIKKELIYIEDYTNMALSYLKMSKHNTDMDISLVNLDDIINPLIKKYAILFISNNIKLEYKKLNVRVITDSKWCMVVIEQLLSNAIKYTKNGTVSITFNEKENYLEIKDNGIGIKESDLPKIFDKGYSGFNGRQNQKSTGIGLFLVKQILDKLGQKVKLESKLDEGTSVKVYFNID